MPNNSVYENIERRRKELGTELTIMGHHYQAQKVIRHTDLRGDSLELARKVRQVASEHIVFCSVYFMAESAALLARADQKVYLPEPSSECSMALMSPAQLLDKVLTTLGKKGRKIVPLTYVNSTLDVKAVVGRHGGSVCTSANAELMLEWAMSRGDAVLFLPDKNLGHNTADRLGLAAKERHLLNISRQGDRLDSEAADKASLLLWPGFCAIHTRFNLQQIQRVRSQQPKALVVVHPECEPEVVAASDANGSTSFIIDFAEKLPAGSQLVIGTEINLVERLAEQHRGRIEITPLVESACTHMAETTEESLSAAIDDLVRCKDGSCESAYRVHIAEDIKKPAQDALEQMLAACAAAAEKKQGTGPDFTPSVK